MVGVLDKFSRNSVAVVRSGLETKAPAWADAIGQRQSSAVASILTKSTARFAIALDATGSMASLIETAKQSISEILKRVIAEANCPVEIMLVAYRDYDVPNQLVALSPKTGDANTLVKWLASVEATGGGANDGEAIERALEAIQRAGRFDAIMLAGDEPPNAVDAVQAATGRRGPLAEDFARRFGQAKIPIHTFVVGRYHRTEDEFAKLARLSGGQTGKLDGSSAMIDMAVMAMLSKLKGREAVKQYMSKFELTANAKEFGQLLLGGPRK